MLLVILASLGVMVASLAGIISLWQFAGARIERNLDYLVSFAAGVFLVITFGLAEETIALADSPARGALWIITGAVSIWLLFKFLPDFHEHAEETQYATHERRELDPRRILLGDGIHNIADGILLAVAFGISPIFGFATAASVFIHELVQETAEFFVLRRGGLSTARALFLNFSVSATILAGAIGTYLFLDRFEALEVPLLGIAGGAFLVIVLNDLIPHSLKNSHRTAHLVRHLLWFVIGAAAMAAVITLVPEPSASAEQAVQAEAHPSSVAQT